MPPESGTGANTQACFSPLIPPSSSVPGRRVLCPKTGVRLPWGTARLTAKGCTRAGHRAQRQGVARQLAAYFKPANSRPSRDPTSPRNVGQDEQGQILKEFRPNGFKLVEQFDEHPWQHVRFLER